MLTLNQKMAASKTDNLNLIRLLLAVLVIFSHAYALILGDTDRHEPFYQWTRDISAGTLAVYAFFFISGFLITASWEHSRSFLDFFAKRVLRIYPAFTVALVGCAVLVWNICPEFNSFITTNHWTGQWIKMVARDAVCLQSDCISDVHCFAHNPRPGWTNGSLWTIPLEFKCYLGVLVAGVCLVLRSRWLVLIMAAFSYEFCLLTINAPSHKQDQFYLCFIFGAAAWMWKDKIPFSARLAAASLAGLVITSHFKFWLSVTLPVTLGYCLLWLAYGKKLPLAGWTGKTDVSYGTYLYAFPIQQILVSHMAESTMLQWPVVNFLITVPVTLALAFLSWTLVEKPCLSLKRFFGKKEEAGPKPPPTIVAAPAS